METVTAESAAGGSDAARGLDPVIVTAGRIEAILWDAPPDSVDSADFGDSTDSVRVDCADSVLGRGIDRVFVTAGRKEAILWEKCSRFKHMSYTSIWPLPLIETKPCGTDLKYLLADTLASESISCVTRIVPGFENLHMRAAVFTVSPATKQLRRYGS